MNKPLVTAIITTIGSDFLSRAISSAINQSYKNLDILICYDGDEFESFLNTIDRGYSNLQVLNVGPFNNANNARQKGIEAAKGEFIALLDDDDFWDENHIENIVESIDDIDFPYVFICSGSKIVKNEKIKDCLPKYFISDHKDIVNFLFKKNGFMQTSSFFFSKNLGLINKFDLNLRLHQDYDWLINLSYFNDKILFKHLNLYTSNYYLDANLNSISKKSKIIDSYNWANSKFKNNNDYRVSFITKVTCKFVKNSSKSQIKEFLNILIDDVNIGFFDKFKIVIISFLVLIKKWYL